MPIAIKPGVDVRGLGTEILLGAVVLEPIFQRFGATLLVTACRDGQHKEGSKHYIGDAIDLRLVSRYNIEEGVDMKALLAGRIALGEQYDFLLEADHFHLEFDPKKDLTS